VGIGGRAARQINFRGYASVYLCLDVRRTGQKSASSGIDGRG
jgi:hypothetical protein